MTPTEVSTLMKAVAGEVKPFVANALQPLEQTVAKHDVRLDVYGSALATLEQKIDTIPAGKDGRDGVDGKDGMPGEPGPAGKDAEIESIRAIAAETLPALVDKAQDELRQRVDAWRPELKGDPGERGMLGPNGPAGEQGQPGRDGVDGKDADPEVTRVIAAEAVTEFVEEFSKALAARFAAA